jgi:hypothetical protein
VTYSISYRCRCLATISVRRQFDHKIRGAPTELIAIWIAIAIKILLLRSTILQMSKLQAVPYGTVSSEHALPGTACQATIGVRDLFFTKLT